MELIDQKLGGTTPMDVVITAPTSFFDKPDKSEVESHEIQPLEMKPWEEELALEFDEEEEGGFL